MKLARPPFIATSISWIAVALVAALAIWLERPPAPVPASASPTEFSAERALQHVRAIAQAPRPIGSAAHAAARAYILQQLRDLGLNPETQKTTAVDAASAPIFLAGTVENILARQRGTGNGRALLLVAHYDSVPTGPGANDDGVGVATLLETARALIANGERLENDVIFLFTDGEESGLLGARAFAAEHPWVKDVGCALNFEARGSGGPSVMFETSALNGTLIRALAKAAPYPLANSFSYEVYKRLPNSTDLTVFKVAGWQGMNFAYISGLTHYHTQLDNLENVDARTVQHHGSYALALSHYFGQTADDRERKGDAIYFNVVGFWLVRYPAWLAWPLTFGVLLFFAVLVWLGFRRQRLTLGGIAHGALLLLMSLIAAPAAVAGAWWIARWIHPDYRFITQGDTYSHGLYVLGFAALALATTSMLLGWFGRRISGANLLVGAMLWWAGFMTAVTWWMIGGSYLITWPLLFALLGFLCELVRPPQRARSAVNQMIAAVCAIPGVLLIVPLVHLIFIAMPFALAPALVAPLVLLSALLIALLRTSPATNRWVFPAIVAALALVCFIFAGIGPGFDKNHRRSNHVLYTLNAATQRALWVSSDAQADEWTKQFFGKEGKRAPLENPFPLSRNAYLQAPAPVAPLRPPEAEVVEDVTVGGVRQLRLHLTSPRGAERISVQVPGEVLTAEVNGKRLESQTPATESKKGWGLFYVALPKDGIDLLLATKAPPPFTMRVVDESYGLPQLKGAKFTVRPAHMMPAPFFRSDFILVSQNYSF